MSEGHRRDLAEDFNLAGRSRALLTVLVGLIFVFFFQAEDGIRDIGVTGVQTCALPICRYREARGMSLRALGRAALIDPGHLTRIGRSEERRVGKECRSRWSPHH